MRFIAVWGLASLAAVVPFQSAPAWQDDDKIERGVVAPALPAPKEAPPAPKANTDKTYPIPMVALAAVGTVMVIAAICIPMRKRDDDDD